MMLSDFLQVTLNNNCCRDTDILRQSAKILFFVIRGIASGKYFSKTPITPVADLNSVYMLFGPNKVIVHDMSLFGKPELSQN